MRLSSSYLNNEKTTSVDLILNKAKEDQIEKNKRRLRPIVDLVILCGHQNIALRGHRDDSKYITDEQFNHFQGAISKKF